METTYSEETLKEAVRLVQEDGWSYGEAMKSTGVPKTTIYSYAKSTVVARKQNIEKRIDKRRQKMNKK